MPPLSKRKYAKSRQRERRGHIKIDAPATDICPQCHSMKLAHRACPTCGYYAGREVLKVKTSKKKST
jgi:large subunit ribosomal protein L32